MLGCGPPLDLEAISALQAEIETIGRAIEEREAQVVDVTREYEDRQLSNNFKMLLGLGAL